MTSTDQIQQTNHFKTIADPTIKAIVLSLDSRKKIRHGVEVTSYKDFDFWAQNSKPAPHVKEIVRELTNN